MGQGNHAAITTCSDQYIHDGKCVCGGRVVAVDGEFVCGKYGVVVGYETAPPDVVEAAAPLRFDGGLRTTIGRAKTDHAGKAVSRPGAAKVMRKRDLWSQKYKKSVPPAMTQLSKLSDDLHMTDAASEYAAYIFRKAESTNFLVGRKVVHCVAAAIFMACRKHDISRTFRDIMKATGLSRHDIFKTYRRLYEWLDPELPVPDPTSFVARIGAEANVCEAARRRAQAILSSMDRTEVAGKDPMGLAASALYRACVDLGVNKRRSDIAKAAGVAETTLVNRFNAITT